MSASAAATAPAALRRVVLFGAESTGKTTLAAALAAHLGEPWSPEYVRAYWDEHAGVIGPGDLDAIARGQCAAEDAAAAAARRLYVCDTDLLTCTLWDDLLFPGACPAWARAEAEQRARATTLFLFCETDLPWAPDPQRCFPDDAGRARCRQLFLAALTSRGLPHAFVRGVTPAQRFQAALAMLAPYAP